MKHGENLQITIEFPNGIKVRGVAVVTSILEGDDGAYGATIPNMHVNFQDGKLVKGLEMGIGEGPMSMTMASGSLHVVEPLMEQVRKASL